MPRNKAVVLFFTPKLAVLRKQDVWNCIISHVKREIDEEIFN